MTPEHAQAYARHLEANPEKPVRKRWSVDTHEVLDGWNGGRTRPSGPQADSIYVREN